MPKKTVAAAPKKTAVRKRAAKAKPVDVDVQAAALTLDYPQAGETVRWPQYTLRLTTPEGTPFVEVAVDGGPWTACRESVGHWWYDWSGYAAGEHTLAARTVRDGKQTKLRRVCVVEL